MKPSCCYFLLGLAVLVLIGASNVSSTPSTFSHPYSQPFIAPIVSKPHFAFHSESIPTSQSSIYSMRLRFALRQSNLDILHEVATNVSDPTHVQYGRYLTVADLTALTKPADESIQAVQSFCAQHHSTNIHIVSTQDFIICEMAVAEVESAFSTTVKKFTHKSSGRTILRASTYVNVPKELLGHVDLITGLHDFFDSPRERRMEKKRLAVEREMTLRERYGQLVEKAAMGVMLTEAEERMMETAAQCAADSSPSINVPVGSEADFTLGAIIYCLNGSYTSNAKIPCSDFPPAMQSIQFWYWNPFGNDPINHTVIGSLANISCVQQPRATPVTPPQVVCSFANSVRDIVPYQRYNITAVVTYSTGVQSTVGVYPTAYTPSPYLTPQKIRSLYNIPRDLRGTNPSNSMGVNEFEEQFFSMEDLNAWAALMGVSLPNPVIVGWNNQSLAAAGGEASLDIEYQMGVALGVNATFWSQSAPLIGNHTEGPAKQPGDGAYILEFLVQAIATSDVALIWSCSYGDSEIGFYQKFGSFIYIDQSEVEFQKFAALGLTFLAASGDAGASNVGFEGNDISNATPNCTPFEPSYPPTSKWVTGVSATFVTTSFIPWCATSMGIRCNLEGERLISVRDGMFWTSGGGFSNMSWNTPPNWQAPFVQTYLKQNAPSLPPIDSTNTIWNPNGRGTPDVSAVGHNLQCVTGGVEGMCDGTSAASPVFSSVLALINDARLNAGYPPLGFVNPLLYMAKTQAPQSFFDITVGSNNDGDIQAKCSPFPATCPYGFRTAPGWSPAGGLGTPNFPALRDFALQVVAQASSSSSSSMSSQSIIGVSVAISVGVILLVGIVVWLVQRGKVPKKATSDMLLGES